MADPITPNNPEFMASHQKLSDGAARSADSIAQIAAEAASINLPYRSSPAALHASFVMALIDAYARGMPVLTWDNKPADSPQAAAHSIASNLVKWTADKYPGWVMPGTYVDPGAVPAP